MRALGEVRRMSDGQLISTAEGFVGDDERSVLYRLKERCHTLFRGDADGSQLEIGASALELLLPLVRNQAAKQVPKDQVRLKERLESGTPAA